MFRRKQTLGERKIVKRFCAICSQRGSQMADALVRPSGLNQKHAQVMTGPGMLRVRLDQGAVGSLRLGQPPGAVIRQCSVKCAG